MRIAAIRSRARYSGGFGKNFGAATAIASLFVGLGADASTDYGPAIWRPVCDGKWYTTGSGHKFYVIHDMEGYYLTSISYMQRCDVSVSVHYAANGKKDNSSD